MIRKNLINLVLCLMAAFLLNACSGVNSIEEESSRVPGKSASTITGYWGVDYSNARHIVYSAANLSSYKGYVEQGELFRIDATVNNFWKITYNSLNGLKSGYVYRPSISIIYNLCWARPTSTLSVRAYGSYSSPFIGEVYTTDIVCLLGVKDDWAQIQYQTAKGIKTGFVLKEYLSDL